MDPGVIRAASADSGLGTVDGDLMTPCASLCEAASESLCWSRARVIPLMPPSDPGRVEAAGRSVLSAIRSSRQTIPPPPASGLTPPLAMPDPARLAERDSRAQARLPNRFAASRWMCEEMDGMLLPHEGRGPRLGRVKSSASLADAHTFLSPECSALGPEVPPPPTPVR